jgi:hypothetical protein
MLSDGAIARPRGLCVLILLGAMHNIGLVFQSLGLDSVVFFAEDLEDTISSPLVFQNSRHHSHLRIIHSRNNSTALYNEDDDSRWRDTATKQHIDPLETKIEIPYSLNATRLLQSGHFDRVARSIARGYDTMDKSSEVCSLNFPVRFSKNKNQVPQIYKDPIEGLYYNKVPKTASSTLAGINQRIAFRWGHRLHSPADDDASDIIFTKRNTSCSHKQAHILGAGKYYGTECLKRVFCGDPLGIPPHEHSVESSLIIYRKWGIQTTMKRS